MPTFKENYNEYTEELSKSSQSEIDSAINYAKEDDIDAEKTAEQEKEIASFMTEVNELQTKMLSGIKVDFKTPDSINHFYRIEENKIIFQIDQVKSYLEDVYKRLSGMKKQKFGEISKEKNFTGTILAIQIALKAMSTDPKNPKDYNIGEINGEYNNITKEAIKLFQTDEHIDNDGKPGKGTIEKLLNAINILIDNKKAEQQEYETLKKDVSNVISESIAINPLSGFYTNSIKEALTIYIVEGNINSGKNPEFESQLINLSNNALNRKLQYLLENSDKSIADNISVIKSRENQERLAMQQRLNIHDSSVENIQDFPTTISENMFQQLLSMEGGQGYTAIVHKKYGENFATGPYGMVYKHIDKNGSLLKNPIPFKSGERTSQEWALDNAKAYYNKKAAERSKNLKAAGCNYNQNQLDALVSASGGTVKSYERLKNFVISHWNNLKEVFEFLKTFARRDSKGNLLGGLISRRNLEADYFMGDTEKTYRDYQREYQQGKKKKA